MTDGKIITLISDKKESGISEIQKKYGSIMRRLALDIVGNNPDADECVNIALLRSWELLADEKPDNLRAFLLKITRNVAFDRYKANSAAKRGGGAAAEALDELDEIVSGPASVEGQIDARELSAAIGRFVKSLPARERDIFIRRYWYSAPVRTIAAVYSLEEGNVRTILSRTRTKLKKYLKEGNYL
ncbi:MAG: sigma-70 family RNA polymerase sigma factor [Clostridia bacterium]|nr:sigma-70 family RNA polymerase sigma factor [Clostridia bacterium]